MTSTLRTLLDRVEQGEGADFELDCRLAWTFGLEPWAGRPEDHVGLCMPRSKIAQATPALTSSIDAAVALVEKVLPGWRVAYEPRYYEPDRIRYRCVLSFVDWSNWTPDGGHVQRTEDYGHSATPPRAIVAALLRAKIAQEERT